MTVRLFQGHAGNAEGRSGATLSLARLRMRNVQLLDSGTCLLFLD